MWQDCTHGRHWQCKIDIIPIVYVSTSNERTCRVIARKLGRKLISRAEASRLDTSFLYCNAVAVCISTNMGREYVAIQDNKSSLDLIQLFALFAHPVVTRKYPMRMNGSRDAHCAPHGGYYTSQHLPLVSMAAGTLLLARIGIKNYNNQKVTTE